MAKANKICKVCGKHYYFCPNCNENLANPKPSWYSLFDSEQCRDIFKLLTNYYLGKLSANEAKAQLISYDLSDLSEYDEDIVNQINTILATNDDVVELETEKIVNNVNEKKSIFGKCK